MSDELFPFSLSHLPAAGCCCGELSTWTWWPFPEWQQEFQSHPWQPGGLAITQVVDTVATIQEVGAATAATPGPGEQLLLSSCSTGGSSSREFLCNFHEFQKH